MASRCRFRPRSLLFMMAAGVGSVLLLGLILLGIYFGAKPPKNSGAKPPKNSGAKPPKNSGHGPQHGRRKPDHEDGDPDITDNQDRNPSGLPTSLQLVFQQKNGLEWTECPKAPAKPEDRRPDKSKLRFMTFNAEWLFLKGGYGTAAQCPAPGCPHSTLQQARVHLGRVAQLIDQWQPDVLSVQELEDCDVLQQLQLQLADAKDYRPYLVGGSDTALGQNVGLLSKLDVSQELWRVAEPAKYPVAWSKVRNPPANVQAKIKGVSKSYVAVFPANLVGPKPLLIVGLHLKADPSDAVCCLQREAQVDSVVRALHPFVHSHSLILAGDLNDFDLDVEREIANFQSPNDSHHVLSGCLGRLKKKLNLEAAITRNPQRDSWWSTTHHGKRQLIDHVLVSSDLAARIDSVDVIHHGDPGVSDHCPILLVLNTA